MSIVTYADNAFSAITCSLPHPRGENETAFAWRERLYARFRGQPYPLLVFEEGVLPAASLWSGARIWSAAFRAAGLQAGDRVVLALAPSPAFLYILIASLWNGLTLALLPPGQEVESAVTALDARLSIGGLALPHTWRIDDCGLPFAPLSALRQADTPPTPDARLLLATSGTTSLPRWIALSDNNLMSVLDSHAPLLNLEGARVLSTLPWHHAFGLVVDLLPALFAGAEIVRDKNGGRAPDHTLALMREQDTSHLNVVPLLAERLMSLRGGEEALIKLRGGIVGGAAVNSTLATFLAGTQLRAGYGQTEASPGIALGQPGQWAANLLGRPVGCRARLGEQGELAFSGANACLGEWRDGGMARLPANRWVDTGDIARWEGQNLFFVGRGRDSFKLSNGRWIHPGEWEAAIKQRFPHLREVLLYSPDGLHLNLLVAAAPDSLLPTLHDARDCLSPLGRKLQRIQALPLSAWRFTPKGSLRREQTLQALSLPSKSKHSFQDAL